MINRESAFQRFVISRSWVRVPQMAPAVKPLKLLRFKGFLLTVLLCFSFKNSQNGDNLGTVTFVCFP